MKLTSFAARWSPTGKGSHVLRSLAFDDQPNLESHTQAEAELPGRPHGIIAACVSRILPKFELLTFPFGFAKCGVLVTLNASARNCISHAA